MKQYYDMNYVELCWLLWIIIFIIIIYLSKKNRLKIIIIILLILIYNFKNFGGPILGLILIILITLTNQLNLNKKVIIFFYNICFPVKILGYKFPDNPTIILCNYPSSYLGYFHNHLLNMLNNDIKYCIMVYKGSKIQSKIYKLFFPEENILLFEKGNKFEETKLKIKEKMMNGYNIISYPEKNFYVRKDKYDISILHSGIFSIAKELNYTITPIVFDHIEHNFGTVSNINYKIYIDYTRKVSDIEFEINNVTKLFKQKLKLFKIKL